MAPTVRLASEADIPMLVEMRRDFTFEGQPNQDVRREDYEQALVSMLTTGMADGLWFVFVGDDGGQLVSHVYVRLVEKVPRPVPGHPYIGYVTNVYTRPAYRNQGIGGRILDEIKAWAPTQGVELLFMWPSDESVEFWQRHGFSQPSDLLVWEP